MRSVIQPLLLGAGFGVAFLLGRGSAGEAGELAAQGRGPVNPPPAPTRPTETNPPAPPLVYGEESSSASSNNGFLAVTGSYGVGTSVLYLVDTVNRQLAVYEARGGSAEQRRIVLVGARRIDLDLQLRSYNDRSEYEYDRLEKLFERGGKAEPEAKSGLEPDGGRK